MKGRGRNVATESREVIIALGEKSKLKVKGDVGFEQNQHVLRPERRIESEMVSR